MPESKPNSSLHSLTLEHHDNGNDYALRKEAPDGAVEERTFSNLTDMQDIVINAVKGKNPENVLAKKQFSMYQWNKDN